MNCFEKVTIPGLKDKFNASIKEGMTEMEMREIGTRIAMEHFKDLHGRINDLRVATGLKREKFNFDDKAKEIKEVRASDTLKPVSQVKADKADTKETPSQIDTKNVTESKGEEVIETQPAPVNSEAKVAFRKGFQNDLDQLSGKIKQKDGTTLKPERKRKKLDGMTTRLKKAKQDGIIDQDEFDEKYEMINQGYTKLPDVTPKASTTAKDAQVPTTGTIPGKDAPAKSGDSDMEAYAQGNSWPAFKNKYPNVDKADYYAFRDQGAKAFAENVRSLKVKNNTLNDAILGIPIAMWNGMLETVATLAEAGGTVAEVVTAAVEYLKANLQGEKFTDKEIEKAVRSEFARVGLVPEAQKPGDPKKSIKENIVDSKFENSERITFRTLFAKINHAKRTTADAIAEIQAEVRKYFAKNGMDMSKGRIVNVMKQLEELASMDDSIESLVDVIDAIDDIIASQEHANDIAAAREAIKKFKKFRKKSKTLLAPYRVILDKIELLSPSLMARVGVDMKQFISGLNTIMDAYGANQGVRTVDMKQLEYMANEMRMVLSDIAVHMEQKSVDKYNLLAAKQRVNGMTYEQWLEDKQDKADLAKLNQKTINSANKGKPMDKLLGLIRLQKERLKEFLTQLDAQFSDDLNDSDYKYQRKLAQEFIDMDIDVLNEEGAKDMNNIMNNIINDGNFFSAGRFLAFWKDAHQVNKENNNNPMRIRYAAAKKARSLATLFMSLTFNEKDAGKLREQLFSPVSEAASAAQRVMYGFGNKKGVIHEMHEILQKFNKGSKAGQIFSPEDHTVRINKVGIFQFLNQAKATDPEVKVSTDPHALEARVNMPESQPGKTKEQDFKDRLNSIINGSVIGRYALGSKNKSNGGATARDLMDSAKATADALVQMGLIEGYKIVGATKGTGGELVVQTLDNVSLDTLYDQLDSAEKELYEFIRTKFSDDEFLKAMRRTAESDHGMLWEGQENYAPQIAIRYNSSDDGAKKIIEDIGNGDFRGSGTKKVGIRPSDRFMQRGNLANPEEFYYSMDAVSNFATSYYEAQLAIHGARKLKALSYVLNSGDFAELMNGAHNKTIYGHDVMFTKLGRDKKNTQYSQMLNRFAEVLRDTVNPPFLYKDTRNMVEKTLNWVMGGITATYLQTSDQVLKQLVPNVMSGIATSGAMPTYTAMSTLMSGFSSKENAEALNKFLQNFEGDFRSAMGEEILDEVNRMVNNPKGAYAFMLGLTHVKDTMSPAIVGRIIMKKSDRAAYNINVIAAYIDAEIKSGRLQSASDFNIFDAAENPNKSSVAQALNIGEMLNNASKAAERAPYTRVMKQDADINDSVIRNIMYLKGFSLNSYMNFWNNLNIATNRNGRTNSAERRAAGLRALSYGVQIGVFNVIKIAILKGAYNAVGGLLTSALFDMEAPDETEEQRQKKKAEMLSELAWQSLGDAALGWMPAPVEAAGKGGINWIYDATTEDIKGERKKLPYYLAEGSGTGAAQALMDAPEMVMEAFKHRGGKSSPMTSEANAMLDQMDWAKLLAFSIGQGDALKVMYGMDREIRAAGKKSSGGYKSPLKGMSVPKINVPSPKIKL